MGINEAFDRAKGQVGNVRKKHVIPYINGEHHKKSQHTQFKLNLHSYAATVGTTTRRIGNMFAEILLITLGALLMLKSSTGSVMRGSCVSEDTIPIMMAVKRPTYKESPLVHYIYQSMRFLYSNSS